MSKTFLCTLVICGLAGYFFIISLSCLGADKEPSDAKQLPSKPTIELQMKQGGITGLSFSPDGRTLAVAYGKTVILWELASRQIRATLKPHGICIESVVFTPDGRSLATASTSSLAIKIWDLAKQEAVKELCGHKKWVSRLGLSPDGKILASGDASGVVKLWDLPARQELATLCGDNKIFIVNTLDFSFDGKTLAVGGGVANVPSWSKVYLWDVESKRLHTIIKDNNSTCLENVVFSPNGKVLATGGGLIPQLQLWDPETGKLMAKYPSGLSSLRFISFSPDSRFLLEGGDQPHPFQITQGLGEARLYDAVTGKQIHVFKGPLTFNRGAFSPDGTLLAIAGRMKMIQLWDISVLKIKPSTKKSFPKIQEPKAPFANEKLAIEEIKGLWNDLASNDAPKAYKALWKLVKAPKQTVSFLKKQLHPVPSPNMDTVNNLIRDLNHEQYSVREKSLAELAKLGEVSRPNLIQALKVSQTSEAQIRIKSLLKSLDEVSLPERLRTLRAVEVLEYIGSPEAQKVLKVLAEGEIEATLSKEAKKSLIRLSYN